MSFAPFSTYSKTPYKCKLKDHTAEISVSYVSASGEASYTPDSGTAVVKWDNKTVVQELLGNKFDSEFLITMYTTGMKYNGKSFFVGKLSNLNAGVKNFDLDHLP